MSIWKKLDQIDFAAAGSAMHDLAAELFPINRSITGPGLRETLNRIRDRAAFSLHEVPSGTRVFDWTVPKEWRVREAWIDGPDDQRRLDLADNNLHLVSYSRPFDGKLSLEELKPKLHTHADNLAWIPYRTSYYNEDWGFCVAADDLAAWPEGDYSVHIDSEFVDGSLSYADLTLPGAGPETVLFFSHACHPSLANDNLSGIVLLTELARTLAALDTRLTYRFVLAPATIGSITWLSRNENELTSIQAGLVASVVGDAGAPHYKLSRRGNTWVDRVVPHVLDHRTQGWKQLPFSPYGYDERQFCSPGIDLPIGRLTRSPNGEYPEYHTSADNLDLIRPEYLADSLRLFLEVVACLESDVRYQNLSPKGEPQLGKRGLYRKLGGFQDVERAQMAMLWALNQSDSENSVLEIASRAGLYCRDIHEACVTLVEAGLLQEVPGAQTSGDHR